MQIQVGKLVCCYLDSLSKIHQNRLVLYEVYTSCKFCVYTILPCSQCFVKLLLNENMSFVYSAEDDTFDVCNEVIGVAGRWSHMCLALRLHPSDRSQIAVAHPGNPEECLQAVVIKWLQRGYNYQICGSPSWRMLVGAVGNPAGGNDCTLAEAIAKRHPGIY